MVFYVHRGSSVWIIRVRYYGYEVWIWGLITGLGLGCRVWRLDKGLEYRYVIWIPALGVGFGYGIDAWLLGVYLYDGSRRASHLISSHFFRLLLYLYRLMLVSLHCCLSAAWLLSESWMAFGFLVDEIWWAGDMYCLPLFKSYYPHWSALTKQMFPVTDGDLIIRGSGLRILRVCTRFPHITECCSSTVRHGKTDCLCKRRKAHCLFFSPFAPLPNLTHSFLSGTRSDSCFWATILFSMIGIHRTLIIEFR